MSDKRGSSAVQDGVVRDEVAAPGAVASRHTAVMRWTAVLAALLAAIGLLAGFAGAAGIAVLVGLGVCAGAAAVSAALMVRAQAKSAVQAGQMQGKRQEHTASERSLAVHWRAAWVTGVWMLVALVGVVLWTLGLAFSDATPSLWYLVLGVALAATLAMLFVAMIVQVLRAGRAGG
ncbi:MAG: hypothetical protein QMD96_03345 [Anaerosomatales bacterium]|nr:hypothetical protein [Anaerosomatales bacterium]